MATPSARVVSLHHHAMVSVKGVEDNYPSRQCGQCKFWHSHPETLCLVCASGVQARLYTDDDIEARFKARRQAYKAQRAARVAVRDELSMCNASVPLYNP
jgi:hypothetical protein